MGGGPARTSAQEIEPGELPVIPAWSQTGSTPTTQAVITGAEGPFGQRVAYGTADGRVHLRVLATGAEIGPAGGTLIADAPVTDPAGALRGAFASTSTDTSPGVLFAVHDDGGGIEVARFDEITGQRLGFDVAVPGALRCNESGAPLLTPAAADGTRLLFFVISGPCAAGEGLVRFPVSADGALGTAAFGRVDDPAADPVLVVADNRYLVAVGRPRGLDLFAAGGTLAGPSGSLELAAGEVPAALANDAGDLLVLTGSDGVSQLHRVTLAGGAKAVVAVPLAGNPVGLAVGAQRIAVATSTALHVLQRDLATAVSARGGGSAPAVSGPLAFQAGRAVRLADGAITTLPTATQPPALARGFVVFGALALATTDVTPPAITPGRGLAATVADDRGVAAVRFTVARRTVDGATAGSSWAPARYLARSPADLAPGPHRVRIRATDLEGNAASATGRLRVSCQHKRRGGLRSEHLRGGPGRDCVDARGGDDVVVVAGGGADRVRCGPGRDTVRADRSDRLDDDCERTTRRAKR